MRLISLHFSQIRRTLARTFMVDPQRRDVAEFADPGNLHNIGHSPIDKSGTHFLPRGAGETAWIQSLGTGV